MDNWCIRGAHVPFKVLVRLAPDIAWHVVFEIKESEIEGGGLGLFAAVDLPKGRIGYYHYDEYSGDASDLPYAIKLPKAQGCLRGTGPMKFMNTATFDGVSSGRNNAKLKESGSVESTRRILAGQEILVAYGLERTPQGRGNDKPPSPRDGPPEDGGNGGNPGGGPSETSTRLEPSVKRKRGEGSSGGQRKGKPTTGAAMGLQVTSQCRSSNPNLALIPPLFQPAMPCRYH